MRKVLLALFMLLLASCAPQAASPSPISVPSNAAPTTAAITPAPLPSSTSAAKPVPSASTVQAKPQSGAPQATVVAAPSLRIVSLTQFVTRGGKATLVANTTPKAQCSITVEYKSVPSKAPELGPKTAGADGQVSWTWNIGTSATPGEWPATVTCNGASQTATFTVQ